MTIKRHMRRDLAVPFLLTGLLLTACDGVPEGPATGTPRMAIPYTPEISINEIMVAQVDHAAHFIWVATNPENPVAAIDWDEVEHHAIQLLSSRAALTMGGTGVNDAMWVAQPSWREYVVQMSAAAERALASSRQRDRAGLNIAAVQLIEACEACHSQYKPSIPTEGYSKSH